MNRVKSTKLTKVAGSQYLIEAAMDDGHAFQWSAKIGMFSSKTDVERVIGQVINDVLVHYPHQPVSKLGQQVSGQGSSLLLGEFPDVSSPAGGYAGSPAGGYAGIPIDEAGYAKSITEAKAKAAAKPVGRVASKSGRKSHR